ncbi:MAG: iron ABC transporter permease [Thermobacillus sp. ZCTH02-B1]|uniref:ABC transporter permease n=1 Tax=Thermobacillus sp. ZCTH02-B1 TaxID=1858795 RepID=UPI000B55A5E7|nr:iron ABC transporter permease [Thermobacillus sp. ZCTH02-B1]OUM97396.1 MAG: iron ABC transporter permease [Thermobacillus sp. ZCTH02-B1]
MNRLKLRAPSFWTITVIVLTALVIIFLVYPFASLFLKSFFHPKTGDVSLVNYEKFFNTPYYFNTLKRSLLVSTVTTVLAVLLGVPVAYITSRFNVWGKPVINVMIILSMLSPPFIGAYSWILLLGRNGFITNLMEKIGITMPTIYGFFGMVLVFTLKLFPYVYLYVHGALGSIDSSLEEAAESLGMNKLRRMLTVTFPVIMPTISAAALVVFMTSMADFGTPLLIGEGYKVLPVVVYEEYMSDIGGDAIIASTLSTIIVLCAVVVLFLQKAYVSRRNYRMSFLRPPQVQKLPFGRRLVLTAIAFIVAFAAMLPQFTVIVTSFLKTRGPLFVAGFSLDSYRQIGFKLSKNIMNTFLFSSIAIVLMILLGLLLSYIIVRRKSRMASFLDAAAMFPYVIPGAVIGIGLVTAFNRPPLLLTGTMAILIVSYIIRKLPFVLRSSTAILQQIDPSIEEASISLGVPPMKTFFKTTAILMIPGLISGGILSWVSTINELSSTLILYAGNTGTISVAIFNEIFKDSFGTAAALASILSFATVISLAVFNKVSGGRSVLM